MSNPKVTVCPVHNVGRSEPQVAQGPRSIDGVAGIRSPALRRRPEPTVTRTERISNTRIARRHSHPPGGPTTPWTGAHFQVQPQPADLR